jgi:hypothetical protein
MNRFRLTGAFPAMACSALATCSPVPRSVLRPRSCRYWQEMTWSRRPPFGPAGQGWVKMCPSGICSPGCSRRHRFTTYGTCGILAPRMNDRPAASMAFWFASLTIPASATTVTSGSWRAVMNDLMTGSIVLVSALLPSNALTMSGKPCWSVSRPMVICGLQPPLLREARLAEPVTGIGLEIQGGHVEEHQACPAEPRMRSARGGHLLPPGVPRIDRQPPLHRGIRRRGNPGLFQHPQRVQLASRLDDARQHQAGEHLITAGGPAKAQHLVGTHQGIKQHAHPRGRDRQRPAAARAEPRAQVQHALTGRQPLPRHRLQQLQLGVIMRGPDVVDPPRPAMIGVHDLHRRRARRRLHRPDIRHPVTPEPRASAQIRTRKTPNPQVTALSLLRTPGS